MEEQVVYIIQECDDNWASELETYAATLDKEKAKKILFEIIEDHLENRADDEDEEEVEQEYIDKFVNDMVDGNNRNHYSDEFPGGNVWCEVIKLS